VSAYLTNEGRRKYLAVTLIPMCVVTLTTSTAAVEMIIGFWNTVQAQLHNPKPAPGVLSNAAISGALTLAMLVSAYVVILASLKRCFPSSGQRVQGLQTAVAGA
jgi:carbon starvation protein CstA